MGGLGESSPVEIMGEREEQEQKKRKKGFKRFDVQAQVRKPGDSGFAVQERAGTCSSRMQGNSTSSGRSVGGRRECELEWAFGAVGGRPTRGTCTTTRGAGPGLGGLGDGALGHGQLFVEGEGR